MLRIEPGDLDDRRVVELLRIHLEAARAITPLCRAYALDLDALRAPDIAFFTAWDSQELLAIGALRDLGAGHGEIKSMHTASAARGRGVGTAMLDHLIATARAAGMTRLSLESGSMDYFALARALYRRYGFSECGPYGDYSADPHNVFMTRTI